MINLPRLMGIGIVLALLATQAQTAALAHSARESQTELMKKRMREALRRRLPHRGNFADFDWYMRRDESF